MYIQKMDISLIVNHSNNTINTNFIFIIRKVFSPKEIKAFDDEKEVAQHILFLAATDNKI